jgi:hypothetical protein
MDMNLCQGRVSSPTLTKSLATKQSTVSCCLALPLQEASGVLAEVAELTSVNQGLNKTFMALAGAAAKLCSCVQGCMSAQP